MGDKMNVTDYTVETFMIVHAIDVINVMFYAIFCIFYVLFYYAVRYVPL